MSTNDKLKNETANGTKPVLCDVCQCSHRRLALKVNEVLVCYDCIDFFKNEAVVTKTDVMTVLNKQTDYVRSLNIA
jgi:hypothetical protein